MRNTLVATIAITLSLAAAGCDKDETGDDLVNNSQACTNIMSLCVEGYSWSGYLTSEAQCLGIFDCVDAFYDGACRTDYEAAIRCLQDLPSADGCAACDAMMTGLSSTCPYPTGCL